MKNNNFLLMAALCLLLFSCGEKPADSVGEIQIGLVCSNLNRSLEFYKNIVGMKETGGFEVDGQFGTDSGLSAGKAFSVKTLKLDDTPGGTTLKLACCSDTTAVQPRFVTDAPGVKYLTFELKSIKAVKERIAKNGIPILGNGPVNLGGTTELVLIRDPDGVFVEFIGSKE